MGVVDVEDSLVGQQLVVVSVPALKIFSAYCRLADTRK